MINFKQPEERAPTALILVSIGILLCTLAYAALAPAPSEVSAHQKYLNSVSTLKADSEHQKAVRWQAQKDVIPRLWEGDAETITAKVLGQIQSLTGSHDLTLVAFRPQRSQALGGVTQLMFNVQITGPYPGIQSVISSLDKSGGKVILQTVQVGSSSASSDNSVTANLNVSAYLVSDSTLLSTAGKDKANG